MKTHDVQSVAIARPAARTFAYLSEPGNLPEWTSAFRSADFERAELVTPSGSVTIGLRTHADAGKGTVDWEMTFPDGAVAWAYSRVTPEGDDRSVYSFVLMAPPVPLEDIEGTLAQQSQTLAVELQRLRQRLEA